MGWNMFATMFCRKCNLENPMVFMGVIPNHKGEKSSVICFDCLKKLGWLDRDGNLKEGYGL